VRKVTGIGYEGKGNSMKEKGAISLRGETPRAKGAGSQEKEVVRSTESEE